jgi:mono/diheme cytochrome c family protein
MKRNVLALVASLVTVTALAVTLLPERSEGAAVTSADAAATYKAKCASCHGADGSGKTATGKRLKLRDLGSPDVQKLTDDQLLAIISKGKGKMPGYQKSLGADTCKALVAYMRQLKK